MEISRNKLVLYIISWIVVFLLAMLLLTMFLWNKKKPTTSRNIPDFVVWTVWDNVDVNPLVQDFKTKYKINWNIIFRNFDSFEDYNLALNYAFNSGTAPDIFVMNNNQSKSIFADKTIWINPSIVPPADVRKNYKEFISDQLIAKNENGVEYLTWLPVWYETLWIFYNRRYVKQNEIENLSSLRNTISDLRQKFPDEVPLAIWNWTTVPFSEDIFTQFMLLNGGNRSLSNVDDKAIQAAVSEYTYYWDTELENKYNEKYASQKASKQNAIDLFANGETFMVAWYPKLINEISDKWFSPSFLLASPFPVESRNSGSLVNFNYFVINSDSNKIWIAENFISYLYSEAWSKKYFEVFPYYLPASNLFDADANSQNIHSKYKIVVSDFYNPTYNYTWFDKSMLDIYNKEVRKILDNPAEAIENFWVMKENISCKMWKIFSLENTSKPCE